MDTELFERALAGRKLLEPSVAPDGLGDPMFGRPGLAGTGGPVDLMKSAKSRVESLASLASRACTVLCFGGRLMRGLGLGLGCSADLDFEIAAKSTVFLEAFDAPCACD